MAATRLPGTPRLLRALNDRAALELLLTKGPLTRAQLGEMTGLSKVTASQLVERLEERGLVRRDAAPGDRRVKMLAVTSNGLEVRRRIVRRLSEAPEPIARLSATDQRALREILNRAFEPGP
jgi:DNA-binding MarR family transcriptional regulator